MNYSNANNEQIKINSKACTYFDDQEKFQLGLLLVDYNFFCNVNMSENAKTRNVVYEPTLDVGWSPSYFCLEEQYPILAPLKRIIQMYYPR